MKRAPSRSTGSAYPSIRRSASGNATCSAAGAQAVSAKPSRRARSARATATGLDPQTTISGRGSTGSTKMSIVPWLGHMFFDEANALPLLAGRDALRLQHVGRLDRDEPRLPVGERLARRLHHRGAGAAAADPAFRHRPVGQDDRLRAGLGGGDGDGADDGRQRERLALRLQRGDAFEDIGCPVHGFCPAGISRSALLRGSAPRSTSA